MLTVIPGKTFLRESSCQWKVVRDNLVGVLCEQENTTVVEQLPRSYVENRIHLWGTDPDGFVIKPDPLKSAKFNRWCEEVDRQVRIGLGVEDLACHGFDFNYVAHFEAKYSIDAAVEVLHLHLVNTCWC